MLYLPHDHEVFEVGEAGFVFGVIQGAGVAGYADKFKARGNFADVIAEVTQHDDDQHGGSNQAAEP